METTSRRAVMNSLYLLHHYFAQVIYCFLLHHTLVHTMGNCMAKKYSLGLDLVEPQNLYFAHKKKGKMCVSSFLYSYVLGEGGFGTVVAALHIKSGKWYAVKEVIFNLKSQKKYARHLTMITNEITAHKICEKHPYICSLHHSFRDRTSIHLVLDLFVGGDLRLHLKNKVVFSEQTVAFLVTCIASALDFMHQKGILHRDVKPDNIMLDEHGFPSLTDFGICHIFDDKTDKESVQVCTMASGTKQYVAPEVLTTAHCHGPAADFWSLGVVGYELIYGEQPFEQNCPDPFIEYNESMQNITKKYDDHSFELKMKCAQQPPLKKTTALKLLLPSRPTLSLPRSSLASDSMVSHGCRSVLKNLLDVRPEHRFKYTALSKHIWFEEQGCIWNKIIHCEVVPPFAPDVMAIAIDVQDRNAKNNLVENVRQSSPSHVFKQRATPKSPSRKDRGNNSGFSFDDV
jgi:serine/threonine protein kinase